jgi:hypothetical protein
MPTIALILRAGFDAAAGRRARTSQRRARRRR